MRLLPTVLAVSTMIAPAAPAYGDPGVDDAPARDNPFLASLRSAGITYQDPDQAISAAKALCGMIDGGQSGLQVLTGLKSTNPGFTTDGAAQFAAIAASVYCPHQLSSGGS